ncbi:MAG TPA: hypothetical protein VMF89_21420, partial [Polyangiales bacterium]|nr:hypothetical protein [Polyangiales bacterium]
CSSEPETKEQPVTTSTAGGLSPRPADSSGTPDGCIKATTKVFEARTDGYGAACVKCMCNLSPESVAMCNDKADACWGVLACVRESCAMLSESEKAMCAVENCGRSEEDADVSTTLEAITGGLLCSADCSAD